MRIFKRYYTANIVSMNGKLLGSRLGVDWFWKSPRTRYIALAKDIEDMGYLVFLTDFK